MVSAPEHTDRRALLQRVLAIGGTALGVMVLVVALAPRLSFVEMRALDILLQTRKATDETDGEVIILDLGIDTSVYEHLKVPGCECEIPRMVYGRLAERLSQWGARVIVFDLMFSRRCAAEDDQVAKAFAEAGNVVVAAPAQAKPGAVSLKQPVAPFAEAVWATGSPASHRPNETIRSVPLLVEDYDSGTHYLAMCVLGLQCYEGYQASDVWEKMELTEARELVTADRSIPLIPGERIQLLPVGVEQSSEEDIVEQPQLLASTVQQPPAEDDRGIDIVEGSNVRVIQGLTTWNAMLINWAGAQETIETMLAGDVLEMSDAEGHRTFRGKAVIIGKTDWDVHWTAVGEMSGPEVQANALRTAISGEFIHPINPWAFLAIVALLATATTIGVRRTAGIRSVAVVAVLALLVVVFARELLIRQRVWTYLFFAETSILAAWGITIAAESGKFSVLLSRFVPSFLGKAGARRAGEVQTLDATILFSDIRQFTSTAEQLDPADMLALLHSYQSAVEDFIAGNGGTIVKTPGDAVLAVFWSERGGVNHATCAFRAACQIQQDLPNHAEKWRELGVELDVGIGINSGSVAIGLVGKHHLEPTVIGDTVNVAQRLESLHKELGCCIIFSDSVHNSLEDEVEAICFEEVTLKGREAAMTVYGLTEPYEAGDASDEGAEHSRREGTNET